MARKKPKSADETLVQLVILFFKLIKVGLPLIIPLTIIAVVLHFLGIIKL